MSSNTLAPPTAGFIGTEPDVRFDRITQLASRFLNAPVSLLTVIDDAGDRQLLKSAIGVPEDLRRSRTTPLSYSFCKHVRDRDEPLVVMDVRAHPLLRENPAIETFGVVTYAGIPFHGEAGQSIGALCCMDFVPRDWTVEEVELLSHLASIADDQLQFYIAIRARAKAKFLAEQAATTRASFLAHASHEVRTPLTNIYGASRLLNTLPLPRHSGRLAGLIERNASKLMSLMEDLIHVSRLDAGTVALEAESYDLVAVLDEIVEKHRDHAESKNLALTLENAFRVSTTLLLDRKILANVMDRLVSNAVNFTSAGGVRVRVENDGSGNFVIRVIDTGAGIAREQQDVLFEEFESHDPRTARVGGGTGLGMTIVRRQVELMGGAVSVTSRRGAGTTFTIRLPLKVKSDGTSETEQFPETMDQALTCLECGARLHLLRRHLHVKYQLTPEDYRLKWGLPDSFQLSSRADRVKRSKARSRRGG
ncbi:ATP-binding protein [Tranquillimonas rosea]|uniref:ATP-binding protein n=1 Tax=Tranquillimonas rosea TaxID=641238 RepID=UPI003BA8BDF1